MATFAQPSVGVVEASRLGKIAGVTLSAVLSVCSRPACLLLQRAYTAIPCLGFQTVPPEHLERQLSPHPVASGDTPLIPASGPLGSPPQPLLCTQPQPNQQLDEDYHQQLSKYLAWEAYQPRHGLAPTAVAATVPSSTARQLGHNSGVWRRSCTTSSSTDLIRNPSLPTSYDIRLCNNRIVIAPNDVNAICCPSAVGRRPQHWALSTSLVVSWVPMPCSSASSSPCPPSASGPLATFASGSCGLWLPHKRVLQAPPYRCYQTISASLRADIQAAASKKQTGVSLKYLLDFGTQPLERQMLLSARFLHAEIPIRLAHRLMDLNNLPLGLSQEPHVRRVKSWYAESFADFRSFPPIKDNMDVVRFTAMLKKAFRRHNNVVPAIAKGVEEYKRDLERTGESTQERESEIQHFLDTFFLSRIAIRFLAGHHISMFEPPRPDHIGLVHTRCSPYMIAFDAVTEARAICFREYGGAPQVSVLGNTGLTMAYVPSHLHHMVFELVKNSLRAVQERFSESDSEPPPIQVVVAEGLEDVTIKVSDQGGGIPRSGLQRIWTYLYTTARSPLPDVDIDSTNMPAVLAGYGCGLPLSRLYARYFGGDLQIISMEGYGTDAYLHLARLGNDEEPLPGAVRG